jgi:diadenylate cyclase
VTDETDAVALIVSEETGALSLGYRGQLYLDLTPEELREQLNAILTTGMPHDTSDSKDEPTRELV